MKWFGSNTDIHDRKRAEEAQQFLVEAGAVLGSSLDYRSTLAALATLAVPRIADWARIDKPAPGVVHASWRAPRPLHVPDVTPLRPRAFDGGEGIRYAAVPFGRAGLVFLAARADGGAPAFHVTEVDRLAQLVRASALVLGNRRPGSWPVDNGRFAAAEP